MDDDVVRAVLLPKLERVRKQAGYWMARCPAHEDDKASLSVAAGNSQPAVLKCFAGCERDDILKALGLSWADICTPRDEIRHGEWTPRGDAIAVYDYIDENGELLYQVCRTSDKEFPVRVPDMTRKSGYRWSLAGVRRVLYRLPKMIEAITDGEIIYVAEGEKDVQALERAGAIATCPPGGSNESVWLPEFTPFFEGACVRIVADKDKPGWAHAHRVFDSLRPVAAAVEIIEAAAGKDAADHLAAGLTLADFLMTKQAGADDPPVLAPDLYEFIGLAEPPIDWLIRGIIERGDRLIWTGPEGFGKALALDTPIPTPKGWATMGELSPGDEVFAGDGSVTRVLRATQVMTNHDCYRIRFSDGAEIIADADHQWLTETLAAREKEAQEARRSPVLAKRGTDQRHKRQHFPAVVTTEQIAETLMACGGHAVNHSVETCKPLEYPAQELPVGPYTLGAWLGDGHSRFASITCCEADAELLDYIRAEGYAAKRRDALTYLISNRPDRDRRIAEGWRLMAAGMGQVRAAAHVGLGKDALAGNPSRRPGQKPTLKAAESEALPRYRTVQELLAQMGVIQNKHIPRSYLEASVPQRLALLQGLMDTDGTVGGKGSGVAMCEFSVVSEPLARDVHELLLGLGIKVKFREGKAVLNGRHIGPRYRLSFQTDLPVFRLGRKAERLTRLRTRRAKLRYITAVEPVESVPVRCIEVDSPDHLYLAGRECIPTHNSTAGRQLATAGAAGLHPFDGTAFKPVRVLVVDCENPLRMSISAWRNMERVARGKGRPVPEKGLHIIRRPEGIDLVKGNDAEWLAERVRAHAPDLVIIGPLYKLHAMDANEELAARAITNVLDHIRVNAECGLIIEAHSPHGGELRPIGSSLFKRWPEFGYGMRPEKDDSGQPSRRLARIVSWRGPRDERTWPKRIKWGTKGVDWPWIPVDENGHAEQPQDRWWQDRDHGD